RSPTSRITSNPNAPDSFVATFMGRSGQAVRAELVSYRLHVDPEAPRRFGLVVPHVLERLQDQLALGFLDSGPDGHDHDRMRAHLRCPNIRRKVRWFDPSFAG